MNKINNKIYTRTGDKGETSLRKGIRVLKSDLRVDTYGTVDELNSSLGIVLSIIHNSLFIIQNKLASRVMQQIVNIQHDLFLIGSTLANPENPQLPQLKKRVKKFEHLIDEMTEELPELHNFILPGGGLPGAHLHLSRTICRRAERTVVELSQSKAIDDNIRMYLNRLSDLLFTMARYVNHLEKKSEILWRKE